MGLMVTPVYTASPHRGLDHCSGCQDVALPQKLLLCSQILKLLKEGKVVVGHALQ